MDVLCVSFFRELKHATANTSSIQYNLACFYARSGNHSDAVTTLKNAFERAASEEDKKKLMNLAHADVDFADIREEPLFQELFK